MFVREENTEKPTYSLYMSFLRLTDGPKNKQGGHNVGDHNYFNNLLVLKHKIRYNSSNLYDCIFRCNFTCISHYALEVTANTTIKNPAQI